MGLAPEGSSSQGVAVGSLVAKLESWVRTCPTRSRHELHCAVCCLSHARLTEMSSLLIATPMLLPKSIWKYPGVRECYPSYDRPMLVGSSNRGALLSRCCTCTRNRIVGVPILRHEPFKEVPFGGTNACNRSSRTFWSCIGSYFMSQTRKWLYAIVHRAWTCI